MSMKPFEIQSPTLSINGVKIDTSAQGKLVLPGVTKAGTSVAIEVEDTGDQTQTWIGTPQVIDGYTYEVNYNGYNQQIVGWSSASYAIDQLDDDGYIDGISVTDGGAGYTGEAVTFSEIMYASSDGTNWVQIPFKVRCGAGEIQSEFGSGGGATALVDLSDTDISDPTNGQALVYNGEVWTNQNISSGGTGDISFGGTDMYALNSIDIYTSDSDTYAEVWLRDNYSVLISADGERNSWEFQAGGNLVFPDGTIQQTAYTGGGGSSGNSISDGTWTFSVNDSGQVFLNDDGTNHSLWMARGDEMLLDGLIGNVVLCSNDGTEWNFSTDGNIYFPDGSVQTTAYTGGGSSTGTFAFNGLTMQNTNRDDLTIRNIDLDSNTYDNELYMTTESVDMYAYNPSTENWSEITLNNYNSSDPNVEIQVAVNNSEVVWKFDKDGNLTVPGNIQATSSGFAFTSTITGITTGSTSVYVDLTDGVFSGPVIGTVTISGVTGTTEVNGTWRYEASYFNQFHLLNMDGSQVDGTTWTAYISGGTAVSNSTNDLTITANNLNLTAGTKYWSFDKTGRLTLPENGDIVDVNGTSVLGGGGASTGNITFSGTGIYSRAGDNVGWNNGVISLFPGAAENSDYITYGQYINIYPTNNYDSPHIHIAAGIDNGGGDLLLGGDYHHVDVNHDGNIYIRTNTQSNQWTFNADGSLQLPAGGDIVDSNGTSVLGGGSPALAEPSFEAKTSNFNAFTGHRYGVDTTSGAVVATLPSDPTVGGAIYFIDFGGMYSTNNLTIAGNNNTIMGQNEDLVVTVNNESFGLAWNGTTWRVY